MKLTLADTTEWDVSAVGDEIKFSIEIRRGIALNLYLSREGARALAMAILTEADDV